MNFGRVAEIITSNMSFTYDKFSLEFAVNFDNDPTPSESEVVIYNLTDTTIAKIKKGESLAINAGYRDDVGLILLGNISKVVTKIEGPTKKTVINVLDSGVVGGKRKVSKAYKTGTKSSYIISDLAGAAGVVIAKLDLAKDAAYSKGYTAHGDPLTIIKQIAKACGTNTYTLKGKLFICNAKAEGALILSPDTGLISSPEYFEEEKAKGYNVMSQLRHSISTGSTIQLKSKVFSGNLYVRKGKHVCNASDFSTEMEALFL